MSPSFLEKIRPCVERRVSALPDYNDLPVNLLDFTDIFKSGHRPVIISEIKFSSPSAGIIHHGKKDPLQVASEYISSKAAALSVLVEPLYFKGDISYIKSIRNQFPEVHILMKDFILSKKQIAEGLLQGANAILLIAAFLNDDELKSLYEYATELGLTAIIEVHNLNELERALRLSPSVIGINNRNLQTLEVDLSTAAQLIQQIPETCFALCESGIDTLGQIEEMQQRGFDGFLIGSSLMKHDHPGQALSHLLRGEQDES